MLHHEIIGGPLAKRTCWVLHGLLGSGLNWRSFIKNVAHTLPHWRFVLPDLRNHGHSAGFPAPHSIAACSDDLEQLAKSLGFTMDAFCAHSLGGKIALHTLDRMAQDTAGTGPPRLRGAGVRAVILDAVPGAWNQQTQDTDRDSISKVMTFLHSTKMPVADRR
jgi:esterase